MCTAPKRHTTKGKPADRSDLQIDPAKYSSTPDATQAKARSDKKLRTLAEARHVDAAAERFLHSPLRTFGEDVQAMTLAVLNAHIDARYQDRNAIRTLACKLAAADVIPDGPNSTTPDWDTTWDLFTSDPTNYPKAIAAASTAICLHQAAGTDHSWNRGGYTALLTWLMHTGYDPADDELDLIEATFAHQLEDHDELTRYVTELLANQPPTPTTTTTTASAEPATSELDDLTARAATLEDGPELDHVNARIAELLDLTSRPYFLCVESTGERWGTHSFATFDEALDAQAAAMEAEPSLILAVHTHTTPEAS
jgi:hypothetical protein